jgi:hypothetical protein
MQEVSQQKSSLEEKRINQVARTFFFKFTKSSHPYFTRKVQKNILT